MNVGGNPVPVGVLRALNPEGTLMLSSADGRLSGIDRILEAMVSSPFPDPEARHVGTPTAIRYLGHTRGKVVISV